MKKEEFEYFKSLIEEAEDLKITDPKEQENYIIKARKLSKEDIVKLRKAFILRQQKISELPKKLTVEYFFEDPEHMKGFISKKLGDVIMGDFIFKTMEETDEIYVWIDGVYEHEGKSIIREKANQWLGEERTTHRINEVLDYIRCSTFTKREEFNKEKHLICLKNGILNLNTMKLEPYDPKILMTNKLLINYNPKAKCPKILGFLKEIMREKDLKIIQEGIGHTLIKEYINAVFFVLIGDGENGKSTFLELLEKFIGSKNISSIPLQIFVRDTFAKAKLFGKLANICADLPSEPLHSLGIIKLLTGRDLIGARKLYQDFFEYTNYAKLWFSCNVPPKFEEDTRAVWRRVREIVFPNRFSENPREYKNDPEVKKADPKILEKITSEKELSGFLNWALEGLKRLKKNGHFTSSKTMAERRELYIKQSDPIKAFAEEVLEQDGTAEMSNDAMFGAFREYCKEFNLPVKSKIEFGRKLPEHINVEHCFPVIDGRQTRGWRGAKIIGITTDKEKEIQKKLGG